ncbi:MAG: DUF4974 domain-containing protein [Cytophagales bacterium]|nr:DUF4974 domain-containing protein [Cytophagales bacterium]
MTKHEIDTLIEKYLANNCSPEEHKLIEGYLDSYQKDKRWVERDHGIRSEVRQRILSGINEQIRPASPRQTSIRPVRWYRIAATVLILLTVGFAIYRMTGEEPVRGKIEIITKEITRGQKSLIHLSDGTNISINSESAVSYPEVFAENRREIILEGEAFFEVAHDPDRPFVVRTGDIETLVLGTSFNINTRNDQIEVTVATGSVRIKNINPDIQYNELTNLSPNEQLIYDEIDRSVKVTEVEADQFFAWTEKRLIFKDEPISSVVAKLERWYDVDFVYDNEHIKHCVLTAEFDNEPLAAILETLHNIADISYELKGKRVRLSGPGCP